MEVEAAALQRSHAFVSIETQFKRVRKNKLLLLKVVSNCMQNSPDLSKINMQGIHVSLTPALQNSIQLRFAALLRHDAQIVRINVRLHRDQTIGQIHHYTATAQVEVRGPDLVAHADDSDAYAALDQVAQKLDQLLERKHNRRKERRNHPRDIELASALPKVGQDAEEK